MSKFLTFVIIATLIGGLLMQPVVPLELKAHAYGIGFIQSLVARYMS